MAGQKSAQELESTVPMYGLAWQGIGELWGPQSAIRAELNHKQGKVKSREEWEPGKWEPPWRKVNFVRWAMGGALCKHENLKLPDSVWVLQERASWQDNKK